MFYVIPKLETFLFANHEAQSIYGYQSLTSYCDMKSANLDLSKVVQYCMFKLEAKIKKLKWFEINIRNTLYSCPADQ